MNIFVVDKDPIKAAQSLCDRHVIKMALESTQLLSTAVGGPYKPTHINHPCTQWVMQSQENFNWLKEHGIALCVEYTHRYGKRHKCQDIIEQLEPVNLPSKGLTEFAQAMPEEYKDTDTVKAYQQYYETKRHFAKWTNREVPEFFKK